MPELLLEKLLNMVEQWTERDRYFSVMCAALLTELIVTINREVDEGEKAPSSIQHIERMKHYIEDQYRNKITKNELGACIGVSPNYAAALFRKVTGLTISEYVHLRRMKTANYMLRHSQLSVQDISDHLGYSDSSYFSRVFKRLVGKLPSEVSAERTSRGIMYAGFLYIKYIFKIDKKDLFSLDEKICWQFYSIRFYSRGPVVCRMTSSGLINTLLNIAPLPSPF